MRKELLIPFGEVFGHRKLQDLWISNWAGGIHAHYCNEIFEHARIRFYESTMRTANQRHFIHDKIKNQLIWARSSSTLEDSNQ